MNSKAKGERNERKARDVLKASGFSVEKSKNSRFGNSDYFNQFDLMGVKEDGFVFVQVKSNGTGGVLKSLEGWCRGNVPLGSDCFDVELWIWYDYKGWRVLRLCSDGWECVLDERRGGEVLYRDIDVSKVSYG